VVTEWREFRSPVFEDLARMLRRKLVVDGRNLYRGEELSAAGLQHWSIGRPASRMAPSAVQAIALPDAA
jgi:UDPglucose 6-dehydrogenase